MKATKMARYILIDNCSGYIFGDSADLNGRIFNGSPTEYAAALDASIGQHGRRYHVCDHRRELASNETGYHVYAAPEVLPAIDDGQDPELIEAVIRDCEYVTTIRCIDASEAGE
jgi:hypothetical protein